LPYALLFLATHEQVEKIICAPPDVQDWSPLFASSEFFTSYGHYLAIDIISPNTGVRWLSLILCVAALFGVEGTPCAL
jgi:hypothetical protein